MQIVYYYAIKICYIGMYKWIAVPVKKLSDLAKRIIMIHYSIFRKRLGIWFKDLDICVFDQMITLTLHGTHESVKNKVSNPKNTS